MIVDSQVHLWPAETPQRPWPKGGAERAHLPYPLTYQMFLSIMDEAGVDRCIIVPPSWEGDRVDYAIEAATRHPDRFAVMGRIALNDPASPALIPTWLDQPGMLGIRLTFLRNETRWLHDGTADWFWPAAEKAGIPVMVHPRQQIDAIVQIAERHPGLRLIIDHMGLNHDIAQANLNHEVITDTIRLARYPNVSVKVSSLPNYSLEVYPFRDLAPQIERVVDAFGPQRCFWGTDLSHSFDRCTYKQRITHITEELDFLSATDKRLILGEAILALLGWPKDRGQTRRV